MQGMLRRYQLQQSMGFRTLIRSLFPLLFQESVVFPFGLISKFSKHLMIGRNGHPLLKGSEGAVYRSQGEIWILTVRDPCISRVVSLFDDLVTNNDICNFFHSARKEKTLYHTNMDGGAYQIHQKMLQKRYYSI